MKTFNITRATHENAALVASILTKATARKVQHGDDSWGSGEWTIDEVRHLIEQESTYIVYVNGETAGTVSLSFSADEKWQGLEKPAFYIHRLAVANKFSGVNLGAQILDWVADEAEKHGCKYLRLDCDASNTKLGKYYEKHGFSKVGTVRIQSGYEAALYERIIA